MNQNGVLKVYINLKAGMLFCYLDSMNILRSRQMMFKEVTRHTLVDAMIFLISLPPGQTFKLANWSFILSF